MTHRRRLTQLAALILTAVYTNACVAPMAMEAADDDFETSEAALASPPVAPPPPTSAGTGAVPIACGLNTVYFDERCRSLTWLRNNLGEGGGVITGAYGHRGSGSDLGQHVFLLEEHPEGRRQFIHVTTTRKREALVQRGGYRVAAVETLEVEASGPDGVLFSRIRTEPRARVLPPGWAWKVTDWETWLMDPNGSAGMVTDHCTSDGECDTWHVIASHTGNTSSCEMSAELVTSGVEIACYAAAAAVALVVVGALCIGTAGTTCAVGIGLGTLVAGFGVAACPEVADIVEVGYRHATGCYGSSGPCSPDPAAVTTSNECFELAPDPALADAGEIEEGCAEGLHLDSCWTGETEPCEDNGSIDDEGSVVVSECRVYAPCCAPNV